MLDLNIKNWLKDIKKNKARFAVIHTFNAIYDRVAVLLKRESSYYIQYPEHYKKGWRIKGESIPENAIKYLQYYVD